MSAMWKRAANRISLILAFASFGMLICSAIVEGAGDLMPMEDWLSGFLVYAVVFFLIYRFTSETPVKPSDA